MNKHNTITQYVVRYKCNFHGVKKDETLICLPTFDRANRFMKGFMQTKLMENPKVCDAMGSELWRKDPEPTKRSFKWELRSVTRKESHITLQIYIRVIERDSNCGTCFHAAWNCEKCMLGKREIHDRNVFTCNKHLPLSNMSLALINEFRFKENLEVYNGEVVSERPMNQNDIDLIIAKEKEMTRKAYF